MNVNLNNYKLHIHIVILKHVSEFLMLNDIHLYIQYCNVLFQYLILHETDLDMSPGPLGTTFFEEIYIRTLGK